MVKGDPQRWSMWDRKVASGAFKGAIDSSGLQRSALQMGVIRSQYSSIAEADYFPGKNPVHWEPPPNQ